MAINKELLRVMSDNNPYSLNLKAYKIGEGFTKDDAVRNCKSIREIAGLIKKDAYDAVKNEIETVDKMKDFIKLLDNKVNKYISEQKQYILEHESVVMEQQRKEEVAEVERIEAARKDLEKKVKAGDGIAAIELEALMASPVDLGEKVKGLSVRKHVTYEVIDKSALIRAVASGLVSEDVLEVKTTKLKSEVKLLKEVPGVREKTKKSVVIR